MPSPPLSWMVQSSTNLGVSGIPGEPGAPVAHHQRPGGGQDGAKERLLG